MMQKDKPWEIFKTMHSNGLENSLTLMSDEDVDLNIIEIHLVSLYNDNIEKWLIETMNRVSYYLQYRYIFESVMNGIVSSDHRKKINSFIDRFDVKYINGTPTCTQNGNGLHFENQLRKSAIRKEIKCQFITVREAFIIRLSELSETINSLGSEEEKQAHFESTIDEINLILSSSKEKVEVDSESSEEDLSKMHGYCFYYKKQLHKIDRVSKTDSHYIKTKNRTPLVLNFDFIRFIYKNDDQLSHELIAMKLIKYLNKLLGKEFIQEYEILPECKGALYEFVEKSLTINHIKKIYKGGLVEYFDFLSDRDEDKKQKLIRRFAETYSGFCLAQYLLDIKDRNNANIMIREDGSIFHIDLAFIFESSPGGINFESAPFKMTKEYVKLMGGFDSDAFKLFETLLIQHFTKVSECRDELLFKLDILSRRSKEIKCFVDYKYLTFKRKIPSNQQKIKTEVEDLIDKSYDSWKTNKYDDFQFKSNDIMR